VGVKAFVAQGFVAQGFVPETFATRNEGLRNERFGAGGELEEVSSPEVGITRNSGAPEFAGPTAEPSAPEAAVAADGGRRAGQRPAGRRRRPRGAAAAEAAPLIVRPGAGSVYVPQPNWRATAGLDPDELDEWRHRQQVAWLRRRRSRELVLMSMLYDYRYLTTDHLRALLFSSLRAAQLRLRWLAVEQRLVMRWPRYEPVVDQPGPAPLFWGLRWRSSVFLLTDLGAALVAEYRGLPSRAAVRRSFYAAESRMLDHVLETNEFWVRLAEAARDLPDQGLYHWIGDDSMRRGHLDQGVDASPDGWGRYLLGDAEIRFSLEWDRGTEPPMHLARKARAYLAQSGGGGNVLVVVTRPPREASVRRAIAAAAHDRGGARFWTAHAGLLRDRGPLGPIWQEVGGADDRIALGDLPRSRTTGLRIEDCIGKPGWWERRPGGGEGA
jgi:Replication-relaxation